MIKRQDDKLMMRLEECALVQGWCIIKDEELRVWYGQKITKTIWTDILDRLESISEGDCEYVIYQKNSQCLVVLDDKNLRDLRELSK